MRRLLLASLRPAAFAVTLTAAHAQQFPTIQTLQDAPTASASLLKPVSHDVKRPPAAARSSVESRDAQEATARTIPSEPEQFKSVVATSGATGAGLSLMLRPEGGSAGQTTVKQDAAAAPVRKSSPISSTGAQEAAAKASFSLPEPLGSIVALPHQCVRSHHGRRLALPAIPSPSRWMSYPKLC
jgi:hypothetical protein